MFENDSPLNLVVAIAILCWIVAMGFVAVYRTDDWLPSNTQECVQSECCSTECNCE